MKITSYGAAGTVTGSCHLLETAQTRVLIDCGMFQGGKELENQNHYPLPFDAKTLDAVFVTHAHLDHVGRLPLLIKNGFSGKMHCTPVTKAISEIILEDAARIAEEDFERDMRKAQRSGTEHKVRPLLYGSSDIPETVKSLKGDATWENTIIVGDIQARFYPSGHIMGSAWIEFKAEGKTVVFSGDLGNRESGVQADFALPPECDAVVIESTYGNRKHRNLPETLAEFSDVLKRSVQKDGKVLIPSFALERTQNILYHLRNLQDQGVIPLAPIYLDSPMASKITKLYQNLPGEFVAELQGEIAQGERPFTPENFHITENSGESRSLNELKGAAIIIAGNGMMSGGRIVHHLKHNLWKSSTSLVIVGFQSPYTLGGRLVAGERNVKILGEEIFVRASIHTIGGFSAHADQDDLEAFLAKTGKAKIHLVHGELDVMQQFKDKLEASGRSVTINRHGLSYEV